ncbi:poly-gamma-glutamate biosynthesis protein PgsC/CapC [Erythrobacter sp. HKB08]|uniref:poly-gamma-glutamate biosynthesis protein PgsC/CapC n=1 Tax=Erythrobacter sp. HKB08 TaxID=2502843 RepID=UPI00100926CF|nr:poly-gamma-glutamate biosynthesis protein PgsC/CapC [Erythrobacter sp. HKB08]
MTLPIFPEGGLASSVITTVWVGVFVLCFFNLRFGWVLSGLVVPGYLVPLIIVKPLAAVVIVIEAILAYTLVWVFSEKIGRGRYPSLFGRDRFMGLILASVLVRLVLDGFALPVAAEWLATNWNQQLDWRSDLQSFGLVIISLMANQFWKPGLLRGLGSLIVVTGLTWLIVRYGLMEFTNFRMSGVSYLYESLSSSVIASPKAYIILILTALYASHMNVKYGWDFSGILIPALIALQWYQPTKILTSFAEAIVIYMIARALLKTPWLANATIEGARKMLLFFNISFALKLLVGHALVLMAWDVKTTDFYGFGYLLSTLLAIKAHDKDIFPRLMRSTLQVSFVGAGVGNLVGFLLALAIPAATIQLGSGFREGQAAREDRLFVAAVGDAYLRAARGTSAALTSENARALGDTIELLEADLPPLQAGAAASAGGWSVEVLGERLVAITRTDGEGRDLLLFDPQATRDLAVVVEDPTAFAGLSSAARVIRREQDARWLIIAAPDAPGTLPGETVVGTFAQKSKAGRLAIRAAGAGQGVSLRLAGEAGSVVDVRALRPILGEGRVSFDGIGRSLGESTVFGGSLLLDQAALARLLPPVSTRARGGCVANPGNEGQPRITNEEQLAFLRFEVVDPLLADVERNFLTAPPAANARAIGMAIDRCTIDGGSFIRLASLPASWDGLYLFAPSGDPGLLIQGYLRREVRSTEARDPVADPELSDRAVRFFTRTDARYAFLAPRELQYDEDQSHAFGVVTQAAMLARDPLEGQVIQFRPRPTRAPGSGRAGEIVLVPDRVSLDGSGERDLLALFERAGMEARVAGRSEADAGFEAFPYRALQAAQHFAQYSYTIAFVPRSEEGEE